MEPSAHGIADVGSGPGFRDVLVDVCPNYFVTRGGRGFDASVAVGQVQPRRVPFFGVRA